MDQEEEVGSAVWEEVFPRASDAKIPAKHKSANTEYADLALRRKPGKRSETTGLDPTFKASRIITTPVLSIVPVSRMVPTVAEARPYWIEDASRLL